MASTSHRERPVSDVEPAVATRLREAFPSEAEMVGWLACVVRRRLRPDAPASGPCTAACALACAFAFSGGCDHVAGARDLGDLVAGLPTARLEALLRLSAPVPA